jgi:cytochrome c oxidase subunit 1
MSNAMHRAGLAGVPRRTAEPQYQQVEFESVVGSIGEIRLQIALGGTILFLALLVFLVVMIGTWLAEPGRGQLRVNSHIPAPLSGAENGPKVLDNFRLWVVIAVLLVALAYGLPLYGLLSDGILAPGSPPIPV